MHKISIAAALAAAVLLGCASAPQPAPTPVQGGPPSWTAIKSGKCPKVQGYDTPQDGLCALGIADSVASYSMGMETATTRARGEMGAVIKTRVDTFLRVVQDSLSKAGQPDETQKVGTMAQSVVQTTLNGVSVPLTYYDKENKVFFAMAAIDMKTLANALQGMKEAKGLSEAAKAEVEKRAASVVEDWEHEQDKAANR